MYHPIRPPTISLFHIKSLGTQTHFVSIDQFLAIRIFLSLEYDTFITWFFRVGAAAANRLSRLDSQLFWLLRYRRMMDSHQNVRNRLIQKHNVSKGITSNMTYLCRRSFWCGCLISHGCRANYFLLCWLEGNIWAFLESSIQIDLVLHCSRIIGYLVVREKCDGLEVVCLAYRTVQYLPAPVREE
jgi:hypothetical protein